MIRLNNIGLAFGSKTILDNVSLHIRRNDRIGLIGPNGTGKSTLFKLICKLIEPCEGNIIFAKDTSTGYLPLGKVLSLRKRLYLKKQVRLLTTSSTLKARLIKFIPNWKTPPCKAKTIYYFWMTMPTCNIS